MAQYAIVELHQESSTTGDSFNRSPFLGADPPRRGTILGLVRRDECCGKQYWSFKGPHLCVTKLASPTYIYAIQRGDGKIKIGTSTYIKVRVRALELEFGNLEVLAVASGTRQTEKGLHNLLNVDSCGGEWFTPTVRVGVAVFTLAMISIISSDKSYDEQKGILDKWLNRALSAQRD